MRKKRVSAQDFTSEMLPKNRVEVYKDIIKNHFGKMLWLGLVLFISLLPMHIFIINRDLSLLSLFSELQNGLITEEVFSQQKISLNQMLSLFNVLPLKIFQLD